MCTPPPSRRHSSPPPRLIDDLVPEILLRIPPDDPACLARASLACKPWRSVLTDPAFLRRYRAFHRTPPILGFLHNTLSEVGRYTYTARFVPTSSFRPAAADRRSMYAMAARHGRVLLSTERPHTGFVVWDPFRDEQWAVPPMPARAAPPPRALLSAHYEAMVFCAAAGCDHLNCHGEPFAVAFVGWWEGLGRARGCVYSSESGEWCEPVAALPSSRLVGNLSPWGMHSAFTSVLVGDVFYFTCKPEQCPFIVEYDMARGKLTTFDVPSLHNDHAGTLTVTEDGRLGFARVYLSVLFLWSWEAGPSGAMAWKLRRNIELNTMRTSRGPQHKVTYDYGSSQRRPRVIGFADDAGVVFVRTEEGAMFSVELKSGRARETSLPRFHGHEPLLLPYLRFCTPALPSPTCIVAGPYTKSHQIEEVAHSFGEFLGDNKKKLDLEGDVDVQVQHSGYADKQRLMGESIDEQWQVWDAIHEQQKLKNQEESRQKQENKKMMLDLEERRKKSAKIHELKMIRAKGGDSRSARKLSQRVTKSSLGRLPLVRSLGVNMLRSPLGVLASVATSKRGRCPSATDEYTPIGKRAKSSVGTMYAEITVSDHFSIGWFKNN